LGRDGQHAHPHRGGWADDDDPNRPLPIEGGARRGAPDRHEGRRLEELRSPRVLPGEPVMTLVTGVDFVSVPPTDLERPMEFYGEVLGRPRSALWQRPGHEPVGAEFETGTVTLALMACEPLGIEFQPTKVPIALRVDDVAAARAELEAQGVKFNGE